MWNYILDVAADRETFCIFVNINQVRHIFLPNLLYLEKIAQST